MLGYLRRALDLTGGTQQVRPVVADRAIRLLAFRDGQIVMRRLCPADQAAFDRFWAP